MDTYFGLTEKDSTLIKKLEAGSTTEKRFAEIFKKIIIDPDFNELVNQTRKELGIPIGGFDLHNNAHRELCEKYVSKGGITDGNFVYAAYVSLDLIQEGYDQKVADFFEKKDDYKIENEYFYHNGLWMNLGTPVREYILTGDISPTDTAMVQVSRSFNKQISDDDQVRNPQNYKEIFEDGLEPFVMDETIDISFSPHTTKDELIEYIEKNWNSIKALKDNILGENNKKKRIKSKKNFFRDAYIVRLFNESQSKGESDPDLKVASILRSKHNIILSEGTIRAIVSRTNKLVSNKGG